MSSSNTRNSAGHNSNNPRNIANQEDAIVHRPNGRNSEVQSGAESQARQNQAPPRNSYTGQQQEIPAQIQQNSIRLDDLNRFFEPEVVNQDQQARVRSVTPSRLRQPDMLIQQQPHRTQSGTPYRASNPIIFQEEALQFNPAIIREDARYIATPVATLISMTEQLHYASNILCWVIVVLLISSLLIGFLLQSGRTYSNPRISIGISGSSLPNSEPIGDWIFSLLTQYPFMLVTALGFNMALYYAVRYLNDLLVRVARISAAIQDGLILRYRG